MSRVQVDVTTGYPRSAGLRAVDEVVGALIYYMVLKTERSLET